MHLKSTNAGFSLVEVLIALTIVSVVVTVVLGVYPIIFKNVINNRNAVDLVVATQQVMDEKMAEGAIISQTPYEYKDLPNSFPRDSSGKPLGKILVWGDKPEPPGSETFQIIYVKAILTWGSENKNEKMSYILTGAVSK
jgi:prepilin-type N-terminal cleavage/methylation domain-containing protein